MFSAFQKSTSVHLVSLQSFVTFSVGLSMTDTMMSPNESARPTMAGTKARPMNSLISNESFLSLNILSQSTNFSVMKGENIA